VKKDNKERILSLMKKLDESFRPLNEKSVSESEWSFVKDEWSFVINNVDASFYGLNNIIISDEEVYEYGTKLTVHWHIEPEFKDWGIESLNIIVDKIEGY
jgi:hypothetical protein